MKEKTLVLISIMSGLFVNLMENLMPARGRWTLEAVDFSLKNGK